MDKLIELKYEPGNKNLFPRWTYDGGDFIMKVVPLVSPPNTDIKPQIDLINSLHPVKLIYDDFEIYEDPKNPWFFNDGYRSTSFLKYKMTKVPYVYQLDENISFIDSKIRNLTPLYTDIDMYNKHILTKYVEVNLKIFPHANTDGGHGNIFQFDIGDWILIDWDDCILGNKHDAQRIGYDLTRESVEFIESVVLTFSNYSYESLLEKYKKTIDFYKKLTYNTVLEDCELNAEEMANESSLKLKRRAING